MGNTRRLREVLLDYWVWDILIVVAPVPGNKRANHKTAVVTFRTAPEAPITLDLGGISPRARRAQPAAR